ncbi:MAG: hypothetical protein DME97_14150 [Verrucomicrobia bacterium]|nr:MAG: hypothetical protein DME97_14150 [Verrucomicrobiota bacterium]
MTQPEPLQDYQPRSMFSTWVGVVLLFAFFGMLAFVAVKTSPRGNTYEKKRAKVRAEKLEAAQKENLTALTSYGWVDKNKGIARIPINDAMKLTLAALAEKKPTAAGPIVAASPSAAPQASPASSAAASAAASASASPSASASASTTPKPTSVTGPDSEARNQPAAAIKPPPAPPGTQPGPNSSPVASAPPAPAKAQKSPSPSASPSAAGTPLPVRGKTP